MRREGYSRRNRKRKERKGSESVNWNINAGGGEK